MTRKHIALLALAGSVFTAQAGLSVTLETQDLHAKKPLQTMKMYIGGTNIAMDVIAGDMQGNIIFRGDRELLWSVDNQKKEYTEITREMLEQMGQSMGAAMKQIEEQMAGMPPEQRAMMEQMMKGQMKMMAGSPEEPSTVKKTGEKKQFGAYPCTKYEFYKGDTKVREMWMTGWQHIKEGKEAIEAFEAMSGFFAGLIESFKQSPFAQMLENPYSHANKVNGFPIVIVEFSDGVASYETRFKEIKKENVPAHLFNPPKGYVLNKPGSFDD